jgi:hypothetical protein
LLTEREVVCIAGAGFPNRVRTFSLRAPCLIMAGVSVWKMYRAGL